MLKGHASNFCSLSSAMVTSPYEYKRDVNQYILCLFDYLEPLEQFFSYMAAVIMTGLQI
jgi:hypothetical protein